MIEVFFMMISLPLKQMASLLMGSDAFPSGDLPSAACLNERIALAGHILCGLVLVMRHVCFEKAIGVPSKHPT